MTTSTGATGPTGVPMGHIALRWGKSIEGVCIEGYTHQLRSFRRYPKGTPQYDVLYALMHLMDTAYSAEDWSESKDYTYVWVNTCMTRHEFDTVIANICSAEAGV